MIYDGKMTQLHPRADCGAGDQRLSADGHGGRGGGGRPCARDPGGRRRAQVVLSLPDGVTMEAGETATFYTNGMATLSIPAQMNAIGVVK